MKEILLFRSLESEQLNEVLDAMFERKVTPNEYIIKQGDDGDNFYVVERYASFYCYKHNYLTSYYQNLKLNKGLLFQISVVCTTFLLNKEIKMLKLDAVRIKEVLVSLH